AACCGRATSAPGPSPRPPWMRSGRPWACGTERSPQRGRRAARAWCRPRRGRAARGRVRSVTGASGADLVTSLRQAGVARGGLVGLVISPALGLGVATADRAWPVPPGGAAAQVGRADEVLRPRWAVWSGRTAAQLVAGGVRLATCWDVA